MNLSKQNFPQNYKDDLYFLVVNGIYLSFSVLFKSLLFR